MGRRDLPEAARLSAARFERLARSADDYICVHEAASRVAGWMHLRVSCALESDPQAWILGLVVDEALRRHGLGRALVAEAERWARARGVA